MRMTTKGKYAVSTMCELAGVYVAGGRVYLQAKDIAKRHFMSELYVEQILNKLKKSGLIRAIRGPNGGYTLAKHPRRIKIGDVIEATEGPVSLVECISGKTDSNCAMFPKCKPKKFWAKLNGVIQDVLDDTTLADLC